jgi:phage tail sheath protein FI
VALNTFGDFERVFGGLWSFSSMSFAVKDFFVNGGNQAIVVRLYHPDKRNGAKPSKTKFAVGEIKLEAANEGSWGANLRATVDQDVTEECAKKIGVSKTDLFNLTVKEGTVGGMLEQFRNLTVVNSPQRVDRVLKAESNLVRWDGDWPAITPKITLGYDRVTEAEKQLENAADDEKPAKEAELINAKRTMDTSDGHPLTYAEDFCPQKAEEDKRGLYALEQVDLFNLLCIPPHEREGNIEANLISDAASYCEKKRAFLIVDPPSGWEDKETAKKGIATGVGTTSKNAALFFPRLKQPNVLANNQKESFVPCGSVAGVFARTDTQRGVWKAPAGLEAILVGVPELTIALTDAENGELNRLGVNCLRKMSSVGCVVWGTRTLQGDDRLASEWKYIPVRRLALFIEESLYRGTKWVVFEPNDEPLWFQIRLNVGAFMQNLFRQGAFQGGTPQEAYFVKCDKETTTPNDINRGIVNIIVGFAPLKPTEFVIIKIQQIAGQIQT